LHALAEELLSHVFDLVVHFLEVVQVISVIGLEERYEWLKQDGELGLRLYRYGMSCFI
jgi:hypothetical protein